MRRIKHPLHPCIVCADLTENKSYCKKHEALAIKPRWYTKSTLLITEEIAPRSHNIKNRRLENVGVIR